MKTKLSLYLSLLLALIFWSCDKEKSGVIEAHFDTPKLLNASLDISKFNLDSLGSNVVSLGSNRFSILCNASVLVSAQYNPGIVKQISYNIVAPGTDNIIARGSFNNLAKGDQPADSSYWLRGVIAITFRVDYSDVGLYHINLTARDDYNNPSNTLSLPVRITRKNIKPQLSDLAIPDTVQIPVIGANVYLFSVAASDSDGYGDIAKVYFYRIAPNVGTPIDMFDDADFPNDGDHFAGDGTFSRLVKIQPSNTPGTNVFLFVAMDKSGAVSDSLTHAVTIIR